MCVWGIVFGSIIGLFWWCVVFHFICDDRCFINSVVRFSLHFILISRSNMAKINQTCPEWSSLNYIRSEGGDKELIRNMYSPISTFVLHICRVLLKMEITDLLHYIILVCYYRLIEFHPLLKIQNLYFV